MPIGLLIIGGLAIALAAFVGSGQYRLYRLSQSTRTRIAARQFEEARPLLEQWLAARPRSAEAHEQRALLALGVDQLQEAVAAVEKARQLGLDQVRLSVLTALLQARTGRLAEAEPALLRAYVRGDEPRADVARELARLYLSTYRLDQARPAIDRWRDLVPDDPRPYLWLNEIASRIETEPATLIENYRAARADPGLAAARLGLAEQLAKNSQLDEAEQQYQEYLMSQPADPVALTGLGRIGLARGEIDAACRQFEAALQADPRQVDALRELARVELQQRRLARACEHLERLTEIEPYEHGHRYQLAQVLKLLGDDARSRRELEKAEELRRANEHIDQLRTTLLARPGDLETRFDVAKWMLEHGHEPEGLDWTRQILQANPGHARTHRLLADYHQKHGNPGLANYHRLLAGGEQDAKKP